MRLTMTVPVGRLSEEIEEAALGHCRQQNVMISGSTLLRRLHSQFLERPQERYDIFPAQHADHVVIPGDGQLVDSIAVQFLERGPEFGIWIDAL